MGLVPNVLLLQRVPDGPLGRHDPSFFPRVLKRRFVERIPGSGQVTLAIAAKPGWSWRAYDTAQCPCRTEQPRRLLGSSPGHSDLSHTLQTPGDPPFVAYIVEKRQSLLVERLRRDGISIVEFDIGQSHGRL